MHEALEVVQGLVLEGVEANRRANARAEAVVACGGASRWGALHRSFVGVGAGQTMSSVTMSAMSSVTMVCSWMATR